MYTRIWQRTPVSESNVYCAYQRCQSHDVLRRQVKVALVVQYVVNNWYLTASSQQLVLGY